MAWRARSRQGALLRDECRGAHYKPEFPERDDEKFLKTTVARYDGGRPGDHVRPCRHEPAATEEAGLHERVAAPEPFSS